MNPVFTGEGGGHRKGISDPKGTNPMIQPNASQNRVHVAEIFDEKPLSGGRLGISDILGDARVETKPNGTFLVTGTSIFHNCFVAVSSPALPLQFSRSVGLDRSQSLKSNQNSSPSQTPPSPAFKPSLTTAGAPPSLSVNPLPAATSPGTSPVLLTSGPEYEVLRLKVLAEACRRRGIAFTPGVTSREQALKALAQKLLAAKTS